MDEDVDSRGTDMRDEAGFRVTWPPFTVVRSRGIPQRVHTLRAAGERPGGLRLPQIVHSQLDQSSSILPGAVASDWDRSVSFVGVFATGDGEGGIDLDGPAPSLRGARYSVTFGEDLKNPAYDSV